LPTFTWHDVLTVSVSEMSRAQAFDCTRHFDTLVGVIATYPELMSEADVLAVTYAPAVVKIKGEILTAGERTVDVGDGETIRLVLPMTREAFMALPMSLTEQWVAATVTANEWLVSTLKKLFSLATETSSVPKSGGGPLNEPTTKSQPIPTTGE
jgi:hypothetical protein